MAYHHQVDDLCHDAFHGYRDAPRVHHDRLRDALLAPATRTRNISQKM